VTPKMMVHLRMRSEPRFLLSDRWSLVVPHYVTGKENLSAIPERQAESEFVDTLNP
jgi:hypothetical protein